jgi:hypothetical protein
VSPVRYELGFYMQEDGILHSHRRENLKFYAICLRPEVTGVETPILMGPLERANLSQSSEMLCILVSRIPNGERYPETR